MNEIIVKIHDEAASKALQKKTPAAMTSLVNEYIRNKVWITQGSLPERRGDWERCTYLFRRFLFECFASGKVPSLLAVLIGFLVESMLLMNSLTISVISAGVFFSSAFLAASSCSFTIISFSLLYGA